MCTCSPCLASELCDHFVISARRGDNPDHVAFMLHSPFDNPWKTLEMLVSVLHGMRHEKAPSGFFRNGINFLYYLGTFACVRSNPPMRPLE